MSQIVGHISQVIGPVVDVYFEGTEAEMIEKSSESLLRYGAFSPLRVAII